MISLHIPDEAKTLYEQVARYSSFVITTHVNPDADAIGSALGLKYLLQLIRGNDAHITVVLPSPCPENLLWMPDAENMTVWKHDKEIENDHTILSDADCIIVLDLNTLSRLQGLGTAIGKCKADIINIDHHTYPEDFATFQWIDTEASSTAQMVGLLMHHVLNIRPTDYNQPDVRHAAMCLYTGIMSDTGSFRFPRTTSQVFTLVAWLVEAGADPVQAYENTFNKNSFDRTKLLGSALNNMQIHHNGRLCTMVVSAENLRENNCTVEDTEGLVHHTLTIAGVAMGILFVELSGVVKCSFRSKGDVYVRDLAAKYAGGGHVYAAGARINGKKLDQAVSEVVLEAHDYL